MEAAPNTSEQYLEPFERVSRFVTSVGVTGYDAAECTQVNPDTGELFYDL